MEYIHVRNLEKYHPGYTDRDLKFAKIFFTIVQGDPDFELITDEIDKWRFVVLICLELQAKKPLPNSDDFWKKKGFNLRKRPMTLTLQMLQSFLEVVTENSETCNLEKNKNKKVREEKEKIYVDFEKSTLETWNAFCNEYPVLSKISEVTGKRRESLKKRFEQASFRDFGAILQAARDQEFLRGTNERNWKFDFDWLIKNDTNYVKVLEHKYQNKAAEGIEKFMRK